MHVCVYIAIVHTDRHSLAAETKECGTQTQFLVKGTRGHDYDRDDYNYSDCAAPAPLLKTPSPAMALVSTEWCTTSSFGRWRRTDTWTW